MPGLPSRLSRRSFLLGSGALAGAVALGACGGGDDGGATADTDDTGGGTSSKLVMAPFLGPGQLAAGGTIRAPFGVADDEGSLFTKDAPASIDLKVIGPDLKQVGPTHTVKRRAEGLPRPYYALEAEIAEAGIYTVRADEGPLAGTEMTVEVSDPKDLQLIRPGLQMPAIDSPTTADPRGVTPICTREAGACPFHEVSVAQALQEQKPLALVVSTPHFCKVAICGPVLDLVIAAAPKHPGVRCIHAEVYTDPYHDPDIATGGGQISPTVTALGLPFEPVLVLVDATGAVTYRLDSIWDASELDDALAKLA
jgi:hypothetical protein